MQLSVLGSVRHRHLLLGVLHWWLPLSGLHLPVLLLGRLHLDSSVRERLLAPREIAVVVALQVQLQLLDALLHDKVLGLHIAK